MVFPLLSPLARRGTSMCRGGTRENQSCFVVVRSTMVN